MLSSWFDDADADAGADADADAGADADADLIVAIAVLIGFDAVESSSPMSCELVIARALIGAECFFVGVSGFFFVWFAGWLDFVLFV